MTVEKRADIVRCAVCPGVLAELDGRWWHVDLTQTGRSVDRGHDPVPVLDAQWDGPLASARLSQRGYRQAMFCAACEVYAAAAADARCWVCGDELIHQYTPSVINASPDRGAALAVASTPSARPAR